MTQDDPLKSALYFDRKSEFYNMFLNSILTEADNLRSYQLNKEFFQNKELKNIDFNEKLINVIFPDVNKIDKNILDDVKEIIASKITRYKK